LEYLTENQISPKYRYIEIIFVFLIFLDPLIRWYQTSGRLFSRSLKTPNADLLDRWCGSGGDTPLYPRL